MSVPQDWKGVSDACGSATISIVSADDTSTVLDSKPIQLTVEAMSGYYGC